MRQAVRKLFCSCVFMRKAYFCKMFSGRSVSWIAQALIK